MLWNEHFRWSKLDLKIFWFPDDQTLNLLRIWFLVLTQCNWSKTKLSIEKRYEISISNAVNWIFRFSDPQTLTLFRIWFLGFGCSPTGPRASTYIYRTIPPPYWPRIQTCVKYIWTYPRIQICVKYILTFPKIQTRIKYIQTSPKIKTYDMGSQLEFHLKSKDRHKEILTIYQRLHGL